MKIRYRPYFLLSHPWERKRPLQEYTPWYLSYSCSFLKRVLFTMYQNKKWQQQQLCLLLNRVSSETAFHVCLA